jgi:hypothetical protein
MLRIRAPHVVLVLSTALFAACGGGGGGSPTTPPPTAALTVVAVRPDPIVAGPCSGCGPLVGELDFHAQVDVRETNGVGVTLDAAIETLRTEATGAVVVENVRVDPGANGGSVRLAGGGTVTAFLALHFPGAGSPLPGVLSLTIHGVDDSGHEVAATTTVRVVRVN